DDNKSLKADTRLEYGNPVRSELRLVDEIEFRPLLLPDYHDPLAAPGKEAVVVAAEIRVVDDLVLHRAPEVVADAVKSRAFIPVHHDKVRVSSHGTVGGDLSITAVEEPIDPVVLPAFLLAVDDEQLLSHSGLVHEARA